MTRPHQRRDDKAPTGAPRTVSFEARDQGHSRPRSPRTRTSRRPFVPLYAAAAVLFVGAVARETATSGTGDVARWVAAAAALALVAALLLTRGPWRARAATGVLATTGWVTAAAHFGLTTPVLTAWGVLSLAGAGAWWWWDTGHGTPTPTRKRPARPARRTKWWTSPALTDTLREAGVIPLPRGDDPPARVTVKNVEHDDYGTTAVLRLPPGVLYSRLEHKREAVAAALDQPLHLVTLTQLRTDPANTARLRVSLPYERTVRVHTPPAVTSWRDPITIGRDRRGRDLTIPTWNTGQVLVGGQTGSGKTHFLRLLAAHYAADPEASLYVVDGKGSTDDWEPIRGRARRLLFIHDDDPARKFLALLDEAQALVTERNRKGGRDWPGVLVILEEFSSLLAALDTTAERRAAERAVTRLAQTCRSANMLVVIAAQRPSATTMDTNTRAQAAVSIALSMKSPRDTEMVLGHMPKLELPDEPGEAIIVTPGKDDVLADLDTIPDAAWFDLCDQWAPREPRGLLGGADPVVTYDQPEPEPVPAPVVEPSPLLRAVADVLTEPMTAADLLAALPGSPWWADVDPQPATKEALGRDLQTLGLVNSRSYHEGRQARWYRPEAVRELLP